MTQSSSATNKPASSTSLAKLSLWDAICLIVGIIIGASIYQYPPDIFRNAGSAELGMFAWLVGGLVSLFGAFCYAELASSYQTAGGDYTYLTRAYGPKVGFIFAWAELSIIRTGGSIACMAYIFANYATEFLPLGPDSTLLSPVFATFHPKLVYAAEAYPYSKPIYAVGAILVLTLINAIGFRPGRWIQNLLTTANFVGLAGICLIGIFCMATNQPAPVIDPPPQTGTDKPIELSIAFMMVLVFYAYGGWNEAAFIASEVKDPQRNIRRSLIFGTTLVMLIYLAVNLAYLGALGYQGVCNSPRVAGEMFAIPFGENGRKAICALVMVSSLGSINGLLFTGMRLYGTFGADHRLFRWLAGKQERPHAYGALFAQAIFSLLLIGMVEFAVYWRQILSEIAPLFNLQLSAEFSKTGDIQRILTCTAPVFWIFFLLTGCSLFILRSKEPDHPRPFRVPFYPIVPLIFCASCGFMLWRSTAYALEQEPAEAFIVGGLMLVGIPLCIFSGNRRGDASPSSAAQLSRSNEQEQGEKW